MNSTEDIDLLMNSIRRRLEKRLKDFPWEAIFSSHFYIAGNSLNRENPNDFDLFPVKDQHLTPAGDDHILISKTKNATTFRAHASRTILQICNYQYPSLSSLVESFDFAHIQVGAEITSTAGGYKIDNVYFTEAYVQSKLLETTWFTGSKYPLSSLIRAFKYHERGNFVGKSIIFETIKIITAIVERGFDGYDDFKDQMDAVDLGLAPEELRTGEATDLEKLFDALLNKENKRDK